MTSSLWTDVFGVPYAQKFYDVAGVRTRVLEAGPQDAPPLIFLHGVNGHAETYIRNIGPHASDYAVYAIDFVGHGLSAKPLDRSYEIETYVQHVLDFMDTIGAPRAYISGESLGGWVATKLAGAHPDRVIKLVLNTPGGLNAEPDVMARLKTMTLDAVTEPTREKVRKRLEWLFKDHAMVPDDLVEMRFQIYSQPGYKEVTERILCLQEMEIRQRNLTREADLQRLSMPTMLVWTTADPIAGVDVGYWTNSHIPDSYFLLMQESGHWPQYEQAEMFNKEHLAFLAGSA